MHKMTMKEHTAVCAQVCCRIGSVCHFLWQVDVFLFFLAPGGNQNWLHNSGRIGAPNAQRGGGNQKWRSPGRIGGPNGALDLGAILGPEGWQGGGGGAASLGALSRDPHGYGVLYRMDQ